MPHEVQFANWKLEWSIPKARGGGLTTEQAAALATGADEGDGPGEGNGADEGGGPDEAGRTDGADGAGARGGPNGALTRSPSPP